MAAESAFNRAAMAQAAVQVEDAVGQIRGQQSTLAGQHGDLMAGWQGEAATAFTRRSAPTSCGFSVRIGMPVLSDGPTVIIGWCR